MCLSFLVLYPLGVYFLRSPKPTAFNLHWTVNSLASVFVSIADTVCEREIFFAARSHLQAHAE